MTARLHRPLLMAGLALWLSGPSHLWAGSTSPPEEALDLGGSASTPTDEVGLEPQRVALPFSRGALRLLESAVVEARLLGDSYISTLHVLLAYAVAGSPESSSKGPTAVDSIRTIARSLGERTSEP